MANVFVYANDNLFTLYSTGCTRNTELFFFVTKHKQHTLHV